MPPSEIITHQDQASRISNASLHFGCASMSNHQNLQDRQEAEDCTQGSMVTTSRWMGKSMTCDKTYQIIIPTDYKAQCHAKMDTRADMVCAGASFVLLENTGKVCNINGFHNHMGMVKGIPIATCAMAYHHLNLQ